MMPATALRRQQLLDAVAGLQLLPSTLAAPMKVLELQRRRDASMEQFAAAITCDPSLVAKILGLVNSAAYKPAKPVTRISQALVMIGLKNLLPLVFGVSLAGIYHKLSLPGEDRGALWRGALLKAVAARECALVLAPEWAEEAHVSALLQDVSLPVIYGVDRSAWPEMLGLLDQWDVAAREARERRMNGLDHAELSAAIAARLGLPETFRAAVADHHRGAHALTTTLGSAGAAQAVAFAARLPHRVVQGVASLKTEVASALATLETGGRIKAVELWARISSAFTQTLTQLGDPDERTGAFKQFMQALCGEVATCLESAIGHNAQVISGLEGRGTELEKNVADLRQQVALSDFDALTKVLNRRGFLGRAQKLAAHAAEHGAVGALGFVDLDDFKSINDTRGHDAGDAALTTVAQRLLGLVRKRGIVGRLGGDEFAFVVADRDPARLRETLDAVSAQMCRFDANVAGGPLSLTCSIGVAPLDAATTLPQLEDCLKRADELMYGAKRAGKGRCLTGGSTPAAA